MLCLLKFLLLFSLHKDGDHLTFARQTPSRRDSRPSVIAASNVPAVSPLIQAYSRSSASASRSMLNNHTHTIAGTVAALPVLIHTKSKYARDCKTTKLNPDIKPRSCTIKDLYCSSKKYNGTMGKANGTSSDDPYLLWDPSCSSNRMLALDTFFDISARSPEQQMLCPGGIDELSKYIQHIEL